MLNETNWWFENLLIFFGIPQNFPAADIALTDPADIVAREYFAAFQSPPCYKILYCKLN